MQIFIYDHNKDKVADYALDVLANSDARSISFGDFDFAGPESRLKRSIKPTSATKWSLWAIFVFCYFFEKRIPMITYDYPDWNQHSKIQQDGIAKNEKKIFEPPFFTCYVSFGGGFVYLFVYIYTYF